MCYNLWNVWVTKYEGYRLQPMEGTVYVTTYGWYSWVTKYVGYRLQPQEGIGYSLWKV